MLAGATKLAPLAGAVSATVGGTFCPSSTPNAPNWVSVSPICISGFTNPLRGSVIGSPVICNAESTWATLAVGLADFRTAQAPVTCGVAIDVPLAVANPLHMKACGTEHTTEAQTESPVASRLRKLALFEKLEIAFCVVVEPTLTALDMQPGAAIPPALLSLPEAMTVAMFALLRLSMTVLNEGKLASHVAVKT